MNSWIVRMALTGLIGLAGMGLFPVPAMAAVNATTQITAPAPIVAPPMDSDFSDADFALADQPELGVLAGGDAVGLLVFILVVVLLFLLILWLLNAGPGHSGSLEIRTGPGHGHGHGR